MTRMQNEDLFVDVTNPDGETPDGENVDYVAELVGEGRKFKSVEDLAKGKVESDRFIANLQTEMAELRADLKARTTFEELLTQMNSETKTPTSVNADATPRIGDEGEGNATAGMTAEQIEKLISDRLSSVDKNRTEAENFRTVQAKLAQAFGNNASAKLKQVTDELGLTPEYVNQLAKSQPQVLLRMVGADAIPSEPRSTTSSTQNSSLNTSAFPRSNTSGVKLKSHYDNIRRTDPNLYWSPKVQQEIHQTVARLGDEFYKG